MVKPYDFLISPLEVDIVKAVGGKLPALLWNIRKEPEDKNKNIAIYARSGR